MIPEVRLFLTLGPALFGRLHPPYKGVRAMALLVKDTPSKLILRGRLLAIYQWSLQKTCEGPLSHQSC